MCVKEYIVYVAIVHACLVLVVVPVLFVGSPNVHSIVCVVIVMYFHARVYCNSLPCVCLSVWISFFLILSGGIK